MKKDNSANKEIIIKIEEGIQTKAFDENNVIHKNAFDRVIKLIENNLEKAKIYGPEDKDKFERVHNTITINGERGAGKTSFMLSIQKRFSNHNEIEVLGVLDPTLISTKQHVFILLISMIEEKVNKKFNDKCREKKYDDKYKKWKKSLEELAKGLNQLDGIGTNPYAQDLWDDSALVMAKGLSMAKAGRDLEWKFHKFVNESLEILSDENNKKRAFLLFIDDIDTDFSKGWDVLEVLRKYITTPQIIPIMAGNFELYENLVRNEKSKLFKDLVAFDDKLSKLSNTIFKEKIKSYQSQLDELTQQYLMKVMQPINMINLHKLYYYLIYKDEKIFVEVDNQQNNCEKNNKLLLKKFIEDIRNTFYRIKYPEYIDVITRLPLRTIFQWLYFAKIYKNDRNIKAFLEANKDIFINNFFNLGISSEFFEIIKTNYALDEFTIKFIKLISFEDIKELKPNYNNLDLNLALMIVPQFLNLQSYLYHKFEYGIKVSLQFYLLERLLLSNKNQLNFEENINLLKINSYLNLKNRLTNSLKIIFNKDFKIKLFVQIYKNKDKINIKTFKRYLKRKQTLDKMTNIFENYLNDQKNSSNKNIKPELKSFLNYLKKQEKDEYILLIKKNLISLNELETFIDKLPLFGIKNIKGTQIDYFASPLKIIALFIDILKYLELEKAYGLKSDNELLENIKNILYSYVHEQNWIIVSNFNIDDQEDDGEELYPETEKEDGIWKDIEKTAEEIIKWYKNNQEFISNFAENFHIIESSRFYYNFYRRIETLTNSCCVTTLDYIKVTLSIFINELISLYLINKKEKTIKQISSIQSIKSLYTNLEKLDQNYKHYINVFIKCPIFKAYLDNSNISLEKLLLVQG